MRRKSIVIVLIVAVLLIAAFILFPRKRPDLSQYEKFREPAFITLPSQKMIVVEATGTPESVSRDAIRLLFKLYFNLDDVPKGLHLPAPRARWPNSLDTPKAQWTGRFALPVPDHVSALPQFASKAKLGTKLETWTYGDTAQILHVGPYDKETPNIERLRAFITAQGYEIADEHEEEYLRGPTMFGKGNPEKYYTLIRYVVRPVSH